MGVGQTVAAGQTGATIAPSRTGIKIGWWAPNPGRPRGRVEGYTEGLLTDTVVGDDGAIEDGDVGCERPNDQRGAGGVGNGLR